MKWASAISQEFSVRKAVADTIARVKADLGDVQPDLAVVFVSAHHAVDFPSIPQIVQSNLGAKTLIGCSAGGVIGGGREVEDEAAFSLTAAALPDVKLSGFYADEASIPSPDAGPGAWEQLAGVTASEEPHFIVLPDPFTIRSEMLVSGLDYAFPKSAKIGGLASAARMPGGNALFLNEKVFRKGAVTLAMAGNIQVDTVVAQGCRPIGKPYIVTRCRQNVLLELDNRKPMDVLREVFAECSDRDRQLINSALHLGIVTDPLLEEFKAGDFLIRNVLGMHQESEGFVIGELLTEGQVVQFHVRDAATAAEDLEGTLRRYAGNRLPKADAGALLFSCVGRGANLFGRPNHDTDLFLREVGRMPLGGFFCNGEIGPVGQTTFLHGFTSSFGIFKPRR
ncbi:MAG: hypothetical protein FJ039_10990 [Chloroflexi bacterium]|nr:hypothetical protein [Chloroflexota bacterium]